MTQGSFLSPGEGPIYSVSDAVKICLKAGGDMTGGALAFYEAVLEPGFGGPPAHIHRAHDELFFVTRGTMRFRLEARMVDAPSGSFVSAPRNVAHAISNPRDEEATFVGVFAPSRYENFFVELADLADKRGGVPEPAEILELMSRYDTEPAPEVPAEAVESGETSTV